MLQIVLTGLAYVFAVLAAIVLLITAMSAIGRGTHKPKRKKNELPKTEIKKQDGPDIDREQSGTDPKIIAAITAAIDAYENEGRKRRFKLLSFRRVGSD